MDRFGQWLYRQGNRQVPTSFVSLGILGSLLPAALIVPGVVPATPGTVAAAVAVGVASWIPMLKRRIETRRELRLTPMGFAGSVKPWARRIGANAEGLERATIDLEQIEALAGKTALDGAEAKALAQAAHDRLWRMFELSVAPPARHGLSLDGAAARFEEDGRWIAEARRLVERTLDGGAAPELGDPLAELRAHTEAREAAVAELRAR